MNPILWTARKINQPAKSQYNILTFPTHEGYQSLLDKTGHNFYMVQRPNSKSWESKYRPIPVNHKVLYNITNSNNFDFILSQEKFGQLQFALELQLTTRLPVVHLEHIEPQLDRWSEKEFDTLKSMRGDINIYITEHNAKSWESKDYDVVPHGIDTELFSGWKGTGDYVLYVVNDLKNRDYFCGYEVWSKVKEIVHEIWPSLEFRLVGDNGDLGSPAKSINELVEQYQNCACYLNTSQLSPIPMSLLEAMSVGCPIVTTAKQQIPKVANEGNSVCSNNINELANGIIESISNKNKAKKLGSNARKTILKSYNLQDFIDNWNTIFDKAYKMRIGSACL